MVIKLIRELENSLEPFGLHLRGIAALRDDEIETCQLPGQSVALVGNIGSSYWSNFSTSTEYSDKKDDPLDRWSKRIAKIIIESSPIAEKALFPSDGPPWLPFLQWAQRGQPVVASPLGLTIHPEYGLWHSYRFALVLNELYETPFDELPRVCDSCLDQPCLNTCPVSAFSDSGYDFQHCASYLHADAKADCHQFGCQARNACPVGLEYRYRDEQHQFHLSAFLKAHS